MYRFAGDRLAVHVRGGRGQRLPVSPFVVGDKRRHFAVCLLIGQEDPFDSSYLPNKTDVHQQTAKMIEAARVWKKIQWKVALNMCRTDILQAGTASCFGKSKEGSKIE